MPVFIRCKFLGAAYTQGEGITQAGIQEARSLGPSQSLHTRLCLEGSVKF